MRDTPFCYRTSDLDATVTEPNPPDGQELVNTSAAVEERPTLDKQIVHLAASREQPDAYLTKNSVLLSQTQTIPSRLETFKFSSH